jgi:hypothetical protein
LDLPANFIEDEEAEAMKKLMKENKSLKMVKLDHNPISQTCSAVTLCENASIYRFFIS